MKKAEMAYAVSALVFVAIDSALRYNRFTDLIR
jgi:hypothetical protein